jgi:hypothetical protein
VEVIEREQLVERLPRQELWSRQCVDLAQRLAEREG